MDDDYSQNLIVQKIRRAKKLKLLDVLVAIGLCMVGIILFFLLFNLFQVSLGWGIGLSAFVSIITSFGYSAVANWILNPIDKKLKDAMLDWDIIDLALEKEVLLDKQKIDELEMRFSTLSRDDKIKLLKYMREDITQIEFYNRLKSFENAEDVIANVDKTKSIERVKTRK